MSNIPLAERLRPKTVEEYIGQTHLVSDDSPLLKSINSGLVPSIIFWGPPGVGKTTLANLIANQLDRSFFTLSAINSGVKDVREVIQKASTEGMFSKGTPILFIDEIHRFSKSQQDSLLGAVEKGQVVLFGATTENPSFEVISALLSRCQVYVLQHHTKEDLDRIIQNAITKDHFLAKLNIEIQETESLIQYSGGDARKVLNLLEIVVNSQSHDAKIIVSNEIVKKTLENNYVLYDKGGEQHYDIASALIKSIRGSDPNAAVYWLARMIEGGEDPKFIARRLLISASEDIGLANPTALVMANNCFQAVSVIGMPESRIILSQCVIYLASSPKGNASYMAINLAQDAVRNTGNLSVPLDLRNAPTKLMKELGYGEDYKYAHGHQGNFVNMEFMPKELKGMNFFNPGSSQKEQEIARKISDLWQGKYNKK
ncbi:MAG: replication-associated recombination protein A [Crocinitomicaceae bacterium]